MKEPEFYPMWGEAEVRAELREQVLRTIELQQQLTEANRLVTELQNVILQRESDANMYGSAFVLTSIEEGELKFKNLSPEDVLIKPATSKRG